MTLTQARALCANVAHEEHQPHRDASALEALARWMLRFSPRVYLPLPTETHGSGLWIDLTGTQRLHGPIDRVAGAIASALHRWGVQARLGVGATPAAAWAGSFAEERGREEGLRDYGTKGLRGQNLLPLSPSVPQSLSPFPFNPLPLPALRLPDDTVTALRHLGIRTIGQLCRLPREELPARFGPTLLRRLDQLFGRVEEPLRLVQPTAPVVAARRWDEPVENLELIWPVAAELIDKIAAQLLRRGHGAREMSATLRLARGAPVKRTIRLSRPSRNPKKLLDLFRRAVEGMGRRDEETERRRDGVGRGLGFGYRWATPRPRTSSLRLSVSSSLRSTSPSTPLPPDLSRFDYNGYVGLRLEVTRWQPIAVEQVTLDGGAAFEADAERDDLIERLLVRLGDAAVIQARPVESYLPERAWTLLDPDESAAASRPVRTGQPRAGGRVLPAFASLPLSVRPPTEIHVTVAPSHDRDGRPVQVILPRDRRGAMPVVHSVGPTRVAGQWWTGHDKSRDYFDIELPDGRRWWVFRVNETGKWFWQGEY